MLSANSIRRGTCAGVLALACLGGVAHAQESREKTSSDDAATIKARQIYREGVDAFNRRDFEAARVAFLKTLALKPGQPVVARNLGLSEIYSGHYLDGARRLARVFHTTKEGSAQDRARMLESLKKAEAHLERLTIEVEVEGAQIDVDGIDLGKSPLTYAWYVAPGTYEVKVAADGYQPFAEKRVANAGVTTHLRVQLASLEAAKTSGSNSTEEQAPAEQAMAAAPEDPHSRGPNGWVIGGGAAATVAAGGLGLLFLSQAKGHREDLEQAEADALAEDPSVQQCGNPNLFGPICERQEDAKEGISDNNTRAIISFSVAGAAAVGTLVYALWPREPDTEAEQAIISLDGISAWPLPGGSTLSLTGRF